MGKNIDSNKSLHQAFGNKASQELAPTPPVVPKVAGATGSSPSGYACGLEGGDGQSLD